MIEIKPYDSRSLQNDLSFEDWTLLKSPLRWTMKKKTADFIVTLLLHFDVFAEKLAHYSAGSTRCELKISSGKWTPPYRPMLTLRKKNLFLAQILHQHSWLDIFNNRSIVCGYCTSIYSYRCQVNREKNSKDWFKCKRGRMPWQLHGIWDRFSNCVHMRRSWLNDHTASKQFVVQLIDKVDKDSIHLKRENIDQMTESEKTKDACHFWR